MRQWRGAFWDAMTDSPASMESVTAAEIADEGSGSLPKL